MCPLVDDPLVAAGVKARAVASGTPYLARGGRPAVAYAFGGTRAHPLSWRDRRPEPDRRSLVTRRWLLPPEEAVAARADLISAARIYDGVILIADPEEHEAWRLRGFVPRVAQGRVALLRFQGCKLRVHAPAGTTVVENTLLPHSHRGAVRRQAAGAGQPIDIADVGCGAV